MNPSMYQCVQLTVRDVALARQAFVMMAAVFEESDVAPISETYITSLLARDNFWAFAAIVDHRPVGCITAHTLPMTRTESSEIFIYDIAVHEDFQRQGIGRALVGALRDAARMHGITDLFVPADDEDTHALDFYRALGGAAAPVTIFSFSDVSH